MTTKYKTCLGKIEPVEVERESATMVWIRGRGRKKRTTFENFFDTREEAEAHLKTQPDKI